MYKVFFKERVIFLSDKRDISVFHAECYRFADIKDFILFLDKQVDSLANNDILILNDDIDILFEEFKNYFLFIPAAGGYVLNDNNEFLAIYRLGKWDLPKGMIEKNESIQEAAIREVQEECGLSSLRIKYEMQPTYHVYELRGKHILKCTYWFVMQYCGEELLVPQLEEDIEKAEWIKIHDIDLFINNTYESIRDLLTNNKPKLF